MDKSWPAADQPHCNMIFDARCACCAMRRVFGRYVAELTSARLQTRTISDCCNCNGIRVARRWTLAVLQLLSDQNAADVARPVSCELISTKGAPALVTYASCWRDDHAQTTRQS